MFFFHTFAAVFNLSEQKPHYYNKHLTMSKIQRTPLKDRTFPDYTRTEEILNSSSHLLGALCAMVMMWLAIDAALQSGSRIALVSGIVYVSSVLIAMLGSSIYHGLPKGMAKQVMRVVDHCDIFFTIAGTYNDGNTEDKSAAAAILP